MDETEEEKKPLVISAKDACKITIEGVEKKKMERLDRIAHTEVFANLMEGILKAAKAGHSYFGMPIAEGYWDCHNDIEWSLKFMGYEYSYLVGVEKTQAITVYWAEKEPEE